VTTTHHLTAGEADTEAVAAALACRLPAGAVVLLSGDLGAGKTAFVRGFAAGLGISADEVSSPTFVVVQEYGGGRLQHVDLYRLGPDEVDDLGLEELSERGARVCVEWAERWRRPPPGAVRVQILDRGDDRRELVVDDECPDDPAGG
jgi:tRNA threonylcarbamoyladenosine biosynthesis protein TsaE